MQFFINKNQEIISEKAAQEEKFAWAITCGKSGKLKIARLRQGRDPQIVLAEPAKTKTKQMIELLIAGMEEAGVKNAEEKAEALRDLVKWSRNATLESMSRKPKANFWLGETEEDAEEKPKKSSKKNREAEEDDEPSSKKKDRESLKADIAKFTSRKKDKDLDDGDDDDAEEAPKSKKDKVRGKKDAARGKKDDDADMDDYLDPEDDGDDDDTEEAPKSKGKKAKKVVEDDDDGDYENEDDGDGDSEDDDDPEDGIEVTFTFDKKTKRYSKYVAEEDSPVQGTLYLDPSIKQEEITVIVKIA